MIMKKWPIMKIMMNSNDNINVMKVMKICNENNDNNDNNNETNVIMWKWKY